MVLSIDDIISEAARYGLDITEDAINAALRALFLDDAALQVEEFAEAAAVLLLPSKAPRPPGRIPCPVKTEVIAGRGRQRTVKAGVCWRNPTSASNEHKITAKRSRMGRGRFFRKGGGQYAEHHHP